MHNRFPQIELNPVSKQMIDKAKSKRLIFTVTPGRSGTALLHKLFGMFPDTTSLHEPEPSFRHVLRYAQINPQAALQFLIAYKIPFIADQDTGTYVETSHLFCKGFIEPFLMCGLMPQIIILRRHPREVALSLYKYNAIPARTNDGLLHLLSPQDPNVLPYANWRIAHDYQLCFWYCLEIERRQRYYAHLFSRLGNPVTEIHLNELTRYDAFLDAALALGFLFKENHEQSIQKHSKICSVNQNPRPVLKNMDFDVKKLENEVWSQVRFYEPFLQQDISEIYSKFPFKSDLV